MTLFEEKGVLTHQRNGRAYKYRPLLTRVQATRNQIRDLVSRFFDGRAEKLIEATLEYETIAPERCVDLADRLKSREQHQLA